MKILHLLVFCFLSGPAVLVKAKPSIWYAPENGNATLDLYITQSGRTKFFCKEKCERAEDILIKTDSSTAQNGRYSMQYKNGSSGRGILSVTFTHLIRSDSRLYRGGFGKSSVPDSYADFEVRVSNDLDKKSGFTRAQIEGEEVTLGCIDVVNVKRKFFCKNQCKNEGDILIDTTTGKAKSGRYSLEYKAGSAFGLSVSIAQLTKSDTGWYMCGYGNPLSPHKYYSQHVLVINASNPPTSTPQTQSPGTSTPSSDCLESFFPLAVCASLIGVLLMAVFLLLFYICKIRRNLGLKTGENADNKNGELSLVYTSWDPASDHEDQK